MLNDDGKILIVLDNKAKTQLVLDDNGITKPTNYKFFTVEVLRTFKPDSQSSMSLDNWAYLQTKQNQEVKNFLSEFGFKHLSDWAILNRARPKQIESLSDRDRQLINVFQALPHVPDEKTAASLPVEQHRQALTDSDAKEIPDW